MNLSQITMVLEVYQKHQLLSKDPYQITFSFYRCKWKKKVKCIEMQVTRLFFPFKIIISL